MELDTIGRVWRSRHITIEGRVRRFKELHDAEVKKAVDAERERLTQVPTQTYDEFKANLAKAVKDDDLPMADMYVQCFQVQLIGLYTDHQSRAAALVEQIEQMLSRCHSDALRIEIGKIIAAHKKGASK